MRPVRRFRPQGAQRMRAAAETHMRVPPQSRRGHLGRTGGHEPSQGESVQEYPVRRFRPQRARRRGVLQRRPAERFRPHGGAEERSTAGQSGTRAAAKQLGTGVAAWSRKRELSLAAFVATSVRRGCRRAPGGSATTSDPPGQQGSAGGERRSPLAHRGRLITSNLRAEPLPLACAPPGGAGAA